MENILKLIATVALIAYAVIKIQEKWRRVSDEDGSRLRKKRGWILLVIGGVAIVFAHLFAPLEEPSNKEELLLEYLENSYHEEFIINGEAKDNTKGAVWAFSVSPIDNREIEFVAGQKKGVEFSSFLLPRFSLVFFDTYSEELTEQTASEGMASETLQPSEQID